MFCYLRPIVALSMGDVSNTVTATETLPNIFSLPGKGTKDEPYIISTEDSLKLVNNQLDAYYVLDCNIQLTESWTPLGNMAEPFTGVFDGNNHIISNVQIKEHNNSDFTNLWQVVGFFGYNSGEIKNLKLEAAVGGALIWRNSSIDYVDGSYINPVTLNPKYMKFYVGGLTGYNDGTIVNCDVTIDVDRFVNLDGISSSLYYGYTGGLAGYNSGSIEDCNVYGSISEQPKSNSWYVGGLAGYNRGDVSHSSAETTINCVKGYCGGLFGCFNGSESASLATSFAKGTVFVENAGVAGGLIGLYYQKISSGYCSSFVKECYSETTLNSSISGGLIGKIESYIMQTSSLNKISNITVEDCYSIFSITYAHTFGGIIGNALTQYGEPDDTHTITLKNCYAAGSGMVSDSLFCSGLIGKSTTEATDIEPAQISIISCFFNFTELDKIWKYGISVSEKQICQPSTYFDWDFDSTWWISKNINNGKPYLRYFNSLVEGNILFVKPDNFKQTNNIISGSMEMMLINTDSLLKKVTFLICFYNESGMCIDSFLNIDQPIVLGANKLTINNLCCDNVPLKQNTTVKIFVWDSIDTMKPICSPAIIIVDKYDPDGVVSVSTSSSHTLALKRNGQLYSWGSNGFGQLGNGTRKSSSDPLLVMTDVVKISARDAVSFAIKSDGSLWAWGNNSYYQLGFENTDLTLYGFLTPKKLMTDVAEISSGAQHTLILKTDGSLYGCGCTESGSIIVSASINGSRYVHTPVKIMDGVKKISAGDSFSLILRENGELYTCGSNLDGQLGRSYSGGISRSPSKIMEEVVEISTGSSHAFAIKTDGSLWAWGASYSGQLGNGQLGHSNKPIKIFDSDIIRVSAGDNHSIALDKDGTVWTWGNGEYGQLGNGIYVCKGFPQQVFENAIFVEAKGNKTFVISREGKLYGWGEGTSGDKGYPVDILLSK